MLTTTSLTEARENQASNRWAFALFLGFLTLYVYTLCPTIYTGDSGEITTAIWSGGVIHPPGYPLFGLLGRLFLFFPAGEPAFRVGLIVALGAAGAVTVLYCICRTIGVAPLASACAAATFGTGYSFWSQSVRVEVYSVHVFLAATALLFALRYRLNQSTGDLYRAAAIVGLGIAHHLTIVLTIPALLVLCGPQLWTAPRLAQRLAVGVGLLLVGPALYLLFFPLWAHDSTLHNWSRPSDLQGIWVHSSAKLYQGILHLPTREYTLERLSQSARWFFDNFLFLGALLSLGGALLLWKKQAMRPLVAAIVILCITVSTYNCCYHIGDITGYYLVCWMAVSVFLAAAFDAIPRFLPRAHSAVTALALIALPVAQGFHNFADCNLHGFTDLREFARQKLEHCDPNAILISKGDDDTFYLQYVQEVLGVRRDVLLIDRDCVAGAWFDADRDPSKWYLYRLREQGVAAPLVFTQNPHLRKNYAIDSYLISLLQNELKKRPLCVTYGKDRGQDDHGGESFLRWIHENYTLLPQGIVMRALPKNEPVSVPLLLAKNKALWDTVTLPTNRYLRSDEELAPEYVNNHYASMLINYGNLYELMGEPSKARQVYAIALSVNPDSTDAKSSLHAIDQKQARVPVGKVTL